MNASELLAVRIAEEQRELVRTRALLDDVPVKLAPVSRASFEGKLADCSARLAAVMPSGTCAAGDERWDAYENEAREAGQLRTEIFCFVAGALLRQAGVDQGIGRAADLLLDELAARTRITNPLVTALSFTTGAESLNRAVSLVRLRFPGAGVWDLPVLAHEFGHHAMHELRHIDDPDRRPILELVRELGAPELTGPVAELFADVYATYALGPAYALSCVVLRLPRQELGEEPTSHPPWWYRVHAMAETLCRMTALTGLPRYRMAASRVQQLWEELSRGCVLPADRTRLQELNCRVYRMVHELSRHVGGLIYGGGKPEDDVAEQLATGATARVPEGSTVAHVLNGAWRWRLDRDGPVPAAALETASAVAIAYCEQVKTGG